MSLSHNFSPPSETRMDDCKACLHAVSASMFIPVVFVNTTDTQTTLSSDFILAFRRAVVSSLYNNSCSYV